jgi:hypothetical protein
MAERLLNLAITLHYFPDALDLKFYIFLRNAITEQTFELYLIIKGSVLDILNTTCSVKLGKKVSL